MTRNILSTLLLLTLCLLSVKAQDTFSTNKEGISKDAISSSELRKTALNVFLDCRWCDRDYIKQTIPYVNYVRNKDEADVHIFVRRQINGGGGGDYTIDFIGNGDFADINDQLKFISPIDETRDETRQARSGIIALGLMQFVARTPIGRNIRIVYDNKDVPERVLNTTVQDDPWNSWMFRLRASGSFSDDQNYRSTNLKNSLSSDRVTEKLKVEFDASYNVSQSVYKLVGTETNHRDWSARTLVVKSIGNNWALGGRAGVSGSIKNNFDASYSVGPAIEYNIFPYQESFKRQIRFQYGVSAIYNNYVDSTVYLKIEETLLRQYLSVSWGVNQEWGNGYLYATYANYLHDFELNNFNLGGRIDYRIYKGLSVSFEARARIVHDQINLRKNDVSIEDILTRQYDLKSGYSYSFSIGLSYSFGSIYNNVVNTRFGNMSSR